MKYYLIERVPYNLDPEHQFRLLAGSFISIFLTVVSLHLFMPDQLLGWGLLIHALLIASTYSVAAILIGILTVPIRHLLPSSDLKVWHIWLASFLIFNLGFALELPFSSSNRFLLHEEVVGFPKILEYLRLLPVWAIFSFILIHVYIAQNLKNELELLKGINQQLQLNVIENNESPSLLLGRDVNISPASISHISVDDHYCYIHHSFEGNWTKVDVGIPLRELMCKLPDSFVQVHRSHVINREAVTRVERSNRNYYLVMRSGSQVPISRAKKDEVLPLLQRMK